MAGPKCAQHCVLFAFLRQFIYLESLLFKLFGKQQTEGEEEEEKEKEKEEETLMCLESRTTLRNTCCMVCIDRVVCNILCMFISLIKFSILFPSSH